MACHGQEMSVAFMKHFISTSCIKPKHASVTPILQMRKQDFLQAMQWSQAVPGLAFRSSQIYTPMLLPLGHVSFLITKTKRNHFLLQLSFPLYLPISNE